MKFPRRWLRVKRNDAFGELMWHVATRPAVATCRPDDRSHLSPDGGGFTRAAVHRLAADGYDLAADGYGSQQMIRVPGRSHLSPDDRSHLSPDGGCFTRAASTAWQQMATVKEPKEKGLLLHPPLSHKPL